MPVTTSPHQCPLLEYDNQYLDLVFPGTQYERWLLRSIHQRIDDPDNKVLLQIVFFCPGCGLDVRKDAHWEIPGKPTFNHIVRETRETATTQSKEVPMLHAISMVQALDVWSDLEAAYYGKNGFGGDTAEIYLYRFLTGASRPLEDVNASNLQGELARETYTIANQAMCALFTHFAETHHEVRIEVDGRELGPWLGETLNTHRVHVKVIHKNDRRRNYR